MPYKRTYKRKRPVKKTYKRKFNIPRRRLMRKSGFLTTTRLSNLSTTYNCHASWVGDNTVSFVQDSATFKFSDLPNYAEMQALFDNYRIVKILYRWVISRNPDSYGAAPGSYPQIMWVHDFNDSTSIGRARMMEHAGMREIYMNDQRPVSRWYSLNPSVLSQTYETGLGAPAYVPKWRQYMDTNDINTPHYGLKLNVTNLYTGVVLKLEAKYVIQLKGVS